MLLGQAIEPATSTVPVSEGVEGESSRHVVFFNLWILSPSTTQICAEATPTSWRTDSFNQCVKNHLWFLHGCLHVVCMFFAFHIPLLLASGGNGFDFHRFLHRSHLKGYHFQPDQSLQRLQRRDAGGDAVPRQSWQMWWLKVDLTRMIPTTGLVDDFYKRLSSIALRRVFFFINLTLPQLFKCFIWNQNRKHQDQFIPDFLNTREWRWTRDGEFAGAEVNALSDSNRIENPCWELHNPADLVSLWSDVSQKRFMYQVKS